jgi:hypothetical protein
VTYVQPRTTLAFKGKGEKIVSTHYRLPPRQRGSSRAEAMTTPALWGQWNGVMQDADSRKWLVVLNVDQARPYTGRILMADDARPEIWDEVRSANQRRAPRPR